MIVDRIDTELIRAGKIASELEIYRVGSAKITST